MISLLLQTFEERGRERRCGLVRKGREWRDEGLIKGFFHGEKKQQLIVFGFLLSVQGFGGKCDCLNNPRGIKLLAAE